MSTRLMGISCTGCSACASKCPKKCISMKPDDEGFLYPVIEKLVCTDCGLCEKICPVLHKPQNDTTETTAFAAYATDDNTRVSSSSGGIFSFLADEVLIDGGIVFGAAFDERFHVHHIEIEKKEELEKLRGSKYVQSDLEDTFEKVRIALENGKKVLFSGVICQIAGLKSYLGKDYPQLLTVDVLCHGVPSPKLWRKYLEYMEKKHGGTVRKMFFRNKQSGWKTYSVSFDFSNDTEYIRTFNKDPFMQMFLQNICLRPSCYECKFNEINRLSDITLGDCWGIDKIMSDMDDDKGTSIVLVHSEKGKTYFDKIKPYMIIRESETDTILPPNSGGRMAVKPHKNRARFFRLLETGKSFDRLHSLVVPPLYVCGLRFLKRAVKTICLMKK